MIITSVKPTDFPEGFGVGWVGFTRSDDLMGGAIAYGERREAKPGFPLVNHALIVTGEDECIQAHIDDGVQIGKLSDYYRDPNCRMYFRRPIGWTPATGDEIVAEARKHIGAKYDRLLIAENALADTFLGQEANKLTHGQAHQLAARLIARLTPHEFVCSYLVAVVLAAMPWLAKYPLFVLQTLAAIDPQLLLEEGPFQDFMRAMTLEVGN